MRNLKSIIFLLLITSFIACKKETSNTKFSYTDEGITQDDIITNYMTQVEGDYRIENFNYIGANKDQTTSTLGTFSGIVKAKEVFSDNYFQTGYLLLNGEKLLPDLDPNYGRFAYRKYNADLFSSKTNNVQLFDVNGKKIIEFTTRSPKPILLNIPNNVVKLSADMPKIIAKWNTDPENKLGVAIQISGDNITQFLFGDESKGEYDLSDVLPKRIGQYSINIFRGTILIKEGADGRRYKFYSISKSTELVAIY